MKKAKHSFAEIQKEQLFLVQLERELTNVLWKINENINTLKVEELQLRSNAVNILNSRDSEFQETSKVKDVIDSTLQYATFNDNPEAINQQDLNLDIYLPNLNEEEDDE